MKFALALLSFLLLTPNSFAQTFTHPLGASPGPQLIVTDASLTKAETALAAQENQYNERLYDLESQIASLQGMQKDLQDKIPKIRKSRNQHARSDGCFNTLGRETKEICHAPFSNDPQTRENYLRARELDLELDAAKASADAISSRLRELEKEAKPLRRQQKKVADQQANEEARMKREIQRLGRQETADRAAELKKEEGLLNAQEALNERQEKRHATELSDLRTQIKKRDVQSALSDLKMQQSQASEAIRIIEEEYDKSLLGIYMQKKFIALLESDVLCKKTAECQSGRKIKVSADEILKLFPNAPAAPKASSSSGNSGTR